MIEFHLYTAKIPVALLEFFHKPKHTLPTYKPIVVTGVSIPVEPVETLRDRIIQVIPDSSEYMGEDKEEGKSGRRQRGKERRMKRGRKRMMEERKRRRRTTRGVLLPRTCYRQTYKSVGTLTAALARHSGGWITLV